MASRIALSDDVLARTCCPVCRSKVRASGTEFRCMGTGCDATFPVVDGVRYVVTGDHATVDADGTVRLLGRGSACINTGGEKVYPDEVEAALKSHPGVSDAMVVGLPDERFGERVIALVVPRPAGSGLPPDLDAHVRTQVAGYKAPRAVVAVEAVERFPSGKPDYAWGRTTALQRLG